MSSATANQPFVFVSSAHRSGDDVVSETRREIAEIVREVAVAARTDRSAAEFHGLLADRTLRALAAEGVVLWQRDDSSNRLTYRCVQRLGRITDRSIHDSSIAAHDRLLVEVGAECSPAVVPPTPGACDGNVPSNPTDFPAALAPIQCDGSLAGADYLLEVFLESGGGVATQRGYLRFVAQMADLAGEFYRGDQLRSLRRRQTLASQVNELTTRIHQLRDLSALQAMIVDGAADAFGFDRVGLIQLQPSSSSTCRADLIAVSHIHSIDQKSPAADQLRRCAELELQTDDCHWNETEPGESETNDSLVVRCIARDDTNSFRLIGLQASSSTPTNDEARDSFLRYTRHASLALQNLESSGGLIGRRIAGMFPGVASSSRQRKLAWASVIAIAAIVAIFPIPLTVDTPAIVRPAMSQIVTAPRDAVVDAIKVRHGETVMRGQALLSMVDVSLDEQISTLAGRRAVLVQQQSRLTEVMVDTSSAQLDRLERVQGERSIVVEEIQSADSQLTILRRIKDSLVIRADRDGIVDAWQVESRLESRPVQRGDGLLRVISADTHWVVEARVPQNRIAHIRDATSGRHSGELTAKVSLDADTGRIMNASLIQIGPAVVADSDPTPATAVLLRLEQVTANSIGSSHSHQDSSGAPARVMFRCGRRPIAYVLFQDLIHAIDSTARMYLTGEQPVADDIQTLGASS